MNTGVDKRNETAAGNTNPESERCCESSSLPIQPCQAWRKVPHPQGDQCGWLRNNLSTARKNEPGARTPAVLLILDQPQYLEIYGKFLRERGYGISVCASPGEGMNAL